MCIAILQYMSEKIDDDELQQYEEEEKMMDYNHYELMEQETYRNRPGENGTAVFLENSKEIDENMQFYNKTGFYVIVSNKISVNRSIPDLRSEKCRTLRYSSKLPSVSIIIIYHNEVMSVLKRTIHSVWNKTPSNLIREIILINDASTEEELYGDLRKYVMRNFKQKIKIKNLDTRKGLIVARMEGARIAKGEILIFLDSHVEVTHNWLPPLIAPIKDNRRIATVPIIDDFSSKTFEYFKMEPTRGVFDWFFTFHEIKVKLEDETKPFSTPVMLGCAFAIDRIFFLDELGGYDEGLQIWNGENYELSFKLHLCADGLWKIPCSRVAHTFRDINPTRTQKFDYVARNFKRIAEVWLDDYKDIFFSKQSSRYASVDAGNLTKQKEIRKKLNCKPFKYFLDEVAADLIEIYPPLYQIPVYASGTLKSLAGDDELCLSGNISINVPLKLTECDENLIEPSKPQHFSLTFFKQITQSETYYCLDAANLSFLDCHNEKGNQYWKYDSDTQMIVNNNDKGHFCIASNLMERTIEMEICDEENKNQKWQFGYINQTAMQHWDEISGYKNMNF